MYNVVMDTERFGAAIKDRRIALRFTRESFAALLGMSASYLNNIERGLQVPSPELIIELAKHLGVSSGYLFQFLDTKYVGGDVIPVPTGLTYAERLQIEQYAKFLVTQRPLEDLFYPEPETDLASQVVTSEQDISDTLDVVPPDPVEVTRPPRVRRTKEPKT